MCLFKEKKSLKKSDIRMSASTGQRKEISTLRPKYVEKQTPCQTNCPSNNDIRGWLTAFAQREKTGWSLEEAGDLAWLTEVETNPFPAVMGRICPHPCEVGCNRKEKDGKVAINSVAILASTSVYTASLRILVRNAG